MSERQYVVFLLDGELYGIDILNVQEITRYEVPTRVPDMPSYIEGMINLRGNIIPLVNLRKKFNLDGKEATRESRIIVLNISDRKTGLLVDAVSRVTKINDEEVEFPQEITRGCERQYVAGLAKKGEKIIVILKPSALVEEART